jgi:hypothetical protein
MCGREREEPENAHPFGVAVCSGMYDHDHISLGLRSVWGGERPFFMTLPDRRQHTYVVYVALSLEYFSTARNRQAACLPHLFGRWEE